MRGAAKSDQGHRAWVFGDDIDTDLMAPGIYMKGPLEELASHCLETVDAKFATDVRPGDVVVGGRNFGAGSSREQAAQALRHLGVSAIVAQSFGGIFYRNALNFGIVAVVCADTSPIRPGDRLVIDAERGMITNLGTNDTYPCDAIPEQLLKMVLDGGLVPHLEKKSRENSPHA